MKNMSLIIGICIGVAVLLLTGVILLEGYQRTKAATQQSTKYEMPSYNTTPDAITQGQRTTLGQQKVNESQSFATDLNKTKDDGGASDLNSISTAASGL